MERHGKEEKVNLKNIPQKFLHLFMTNLRGVWRILLMVYSLQIFLAAEVKPKALNPLPMDPSEEDSNLKIFPDLESWSSLFPLHNQIIQWIPRIYI